MTHPRAATASPRRHRRRLLTTAVGLLVAALLLPAGPAAAAALPEDAVEAPLPSEAPLPTEDPEPAPAEFTSAPGARVTGTYAVGRTLVATTSPWTPEASFSYEWLRDGRVVGGNQTTYRLTAADEGRVLSIRVTGSADDVTTRSVTTAGRRVAAGTFSTAPAPTVAGAVRVGQRLTASAGSWSPRVTPAYRWSVAGKPVPGATGRTFTPRPADRGKKVAVTVTARLDGYTTVVRTSRAATVGYAAVGSTVRARYESLRGAKGFLGHPKAAQACDARRTRCTQAFAHGTIDWRRGKGAQVAEISKSSSTYVVVNKKRPLSPRSYAPTVRRVSGQPVQLRSNAASALESLLRDASRAGVPLRAQSGYRSYATQQGTYAHWVRVLGRQEADRQSARAGHSEHQTGLAVDVLPRGGSCQSFGCFGSTPQSRWVAKHAHEYGFVVRYRSGQESTTGYTAEPWHLRYVGVRLATDMKVTGSTSLEAHFGLPRAPRY